MAYANGSVPSNLLMRLPDTPNLPDGRAPRHTLAACIDFYVLRARCERDTGIRIGVNDTYRTGADQKIMRARYGAGAAPIIVRNGKEIFTSNHGNFDQPAIDARLDSYTSQQYIYVRDNGRALGWYVNAVKGEYWHIQHNGSSVYAPWNEYANWFLSPQTISEWQRLSGTPVDGFLSINGSEVVRASQRYSNAKYGMNLPVDGILGAMTWRGIQRDIREKVDGSLVIDGMPGEATRAGMRLLLTM